MGQDVVEGDGLECGEPDGREAVRVLLLQRLDDAGMLRAKGQSAEAHTAFRGRLVKHLSYMTAANLMTMAEVIMDHAAGPGRNQWPAEVVIWSLARDLQPRPPIRHKIVSSWFTSIEGPKAEMAGELVELYRFLCQVRRPPGPMDRIRIREEAADNARTRELVRSRIERGCASPEDHGWMERYAADQREAQQLVDQGRGKRGAA